MSLSDIISDSGLHVSDYKAVSGGDINRAWCLQAKNEKYFLKTNSASDFPGMFEKEAKGLETLRTSFSLKVPEVIKHGVVGDNQYLLLEWIGQGNKKNNFWNDFGIALAQLHKKKQTYFGFEENNYIGSIDQLNTPSESWDEFYGEKRILFLAKKLSDSGAFTKEDLILAQRFCSKLDQLFPEENPALLHGDLWSGNFMCDVNGQACIYDPAVYYGHREMDLGMTKLFRGFQPEFYEAYNSEYPLEKNWEERLPITQLYPLLVHAVLFGGAYVNSSITTMKRFV